MANTAFRAAERAARAWDPSHVNTESSFNPIDFEKLSQLSEADCLSAGRPFGLKIVKCQHIFGEAYVLVDDPESMSNDIENRHYADGFVFVRNALSAESQREIALQCLLQWIEPPFASNLDPQLLEALPGKVELATDDKGKVVAHSSNEYSDDTERRRGYGSFNASCKKQRKETGPRASSAMVPELIPTDQEQTADLSGAAFNDAVLTPELFARCVGRLPELRSGLFEQYADQRLAAESSSTVGAAGKSSSKVRGRKPAIPSPLSSMLEKLTWTVFGHQYDWTARTYPSGDFVPLPGDLVRLVERLTQETQEAVSRSSDSSVASRSPSLTIKPEAGIINLYGLRHHKSLGGHLDDAEFTMDAPVLSISLGPSCIFLIGGGTRGAAPVPVLLRSGDICFMAGKSRRCTHAVPRVLLNLPRESALPQFAPDAVFLLHGEPIPSRLAAAASAFLQQNRLNINVRQVFPTPPENCAPTPACGCSFCSSAPTVSANVRQVVQGTLFDRLELLRRDLLAKVDNTWQCREAYAFAYDLSHQDVDRILAFVRACAAFVPKFDPSLVAREWRPVLKSGTQKQVSFRIMQFNTLADSLHDAFPNASPHVLPWSYRAPRLLAEISRIAADVVCLEEVDETSYYAWFAPKLALLGFAGLFSKKRGADSKDGLAMFWRMDSFTLLHHTTVALGQQEDSQVGLICRLRHACSLRAVIVACTHLKAKPGFEDKRLRQGVQLLEAVAGFAVQGVDHLSDSSTEFPAICVCGDFNDEPSSPVYNFFASGKTTVEERAITHQLSLGSVYRQYSDGITSEPYSTFKYRQDVIRRTIDYIWISQALQVRSLLEIPDPALFAQCLPCEHYPSDHLALAATLEFS